MAAGVGTQRYIVATGFRRVGKWQARIFLTLLEDNGLTGATLAIRIGYIRWFGSALGHQALYQTLHRLKKDGMLENGTWGQYYLTPKGEALAKRLS